MSPEQRGTIAELSRLRREIAADREAMVRREVDLRRLASDWPDVARNRANQAFVGTILHSWYTGLEAICERVARQLDRDVPIGERWHQELLSRALTEIPGVRPALLSAEIETDLLSLLAFRHFFRHAYGAELDSARLRIECDRLLALSARVTADLDRFDAFLVEVIANASA